MLICIPRPARSAPWPELVVVGVGEGPRFAATEGSAVCTSRLALPRCTRRVRAVVALARRLATPGGSRRHEQRAFAGMMPRSTPRVRLAPPSRRATMGRWGEGGRRPTAVRVTGQTGVHRPAAWQGGVGVRRPQGAWLWAGGGCIGVKGGVLSLRCGASEVGPPPRRVSGGPRVLRCPTASRAGRRALLRPPTPARLAGAGAAGG